MAGMAFAASIARSLRLVLAPALALALALAGSLAVPVPAGAANLQPHRAVYRMALGAAAKRSEVVAAQGQMFYRFSRDCDGWRVENRTVLRLTYEGGSDVDTLWTFASWESFDGRRFHFHARYQQDGDTLERLDGEAHMNADGKGGRAEFSVPEGQTVDLPAETLFPTEHVRALIASAEAGQRTLSRVVFDGASVENPYLVNAVNGPLPQAAAEALAKTIGLPIARSWWTRMAFFPYASDGAMPEFEIGAHYRDDGIADRITQQFDGLALDVRLSEFEALPSPSC